MPFTVAQFLDVFRRYNEAVWPMQWVLLLLAVVAVWRAARGTPADSRLVAGVLAALWGWTGTVYHLGFFRAINPAATIFAVMFLAEAALFGWATTRRGAMRFRARRNLATAAGAAPMLYALVLYPTLGHALGHRYPTAPTFGLPCPTTIFTLGLLLWAEPPARWTFVIVPVAWAALGTVAAARLGMLEDYGLPIAAIVAIVVLVAARREAAAGRAFTGRAPTALT